jgi:hypothetical protein
VAEALSEESSVFDTDFFGHRFGLVAREHVESSAKQRDEYVVVTNREIEVIAFGRGGVALGRPASPGSASCSRKLLTPSRRGSSAG